MDLKDIKLKDSEVGFLEIYDATIVKAINQESNIFSLLKDFGKPEPLISEIEEVLRNIQKKIDYESETCDCYGNNPLDDEGY